MSSLFDYVPHPHLERRAAQGPATTAAVHHEYAARGAAARINAAVAVRITGIVGTMWCAYLFVALTLVSAPDAFRSGNAIIIVAWIAQTFLQLVLLPIIIVGQNVQAAAADKRAQATYDDAVAVLEEARQIQQHLLAQDEAIASVLTELRSRAS